MKIKFIVKPPTKKEYRREFLRLKQELWESAEEEFTEKEGPKNARNLAKKAIEEGFDRIVVVGGDGLMNEVVNGIMEATGGKIPQNFVLGTIPTGAGNNFAKELGIPKDIQKAFLIIKQGRIIPIDIGKVNDRFFANCLSFGFDALINKVANDIKTKYQFLPKGASYLLAAIKEIIINIPLFEIEIKNEEIDFKGKVILAAITNTPSYGTIFKINPSAKVNDGKLDICIIKPVGKIRAFLDLYRVSQANHVHLPEMKLFKLSLLTVSSPQFLPWEIDGEVQEPAKEFKIEVLPRLINISMP